MKDRNQLGFTLLELMVTVAILAILAIIAVPSYQAMQNSATVRNVLSQWRSSFFYAQKEAMRRKQNIILCASQNGQTCDQNNGGFQNGWIVAYEDKGSLIILQDTLPPKIKDLSMTLSKAGSKSKFIIKPNGNISSFQGGTLNVTIKKDNKVIAARSLVISAQGRMRVENRIIDTQE